MTPLRFGIAGCGNISGLQGPVLTTLKADGLAEIVAVTDVLPERAQAFAAKYGGTVAPSFEAMLALPNVDAVTLCTPSGLHGQMAAQAAHAGKHVLSEKPLDVWLAPLDEAIAAAQKAGVVYGGIFNKRFTPAARKVKRAIDAGALGDVVLVGAETKWLRTQAYYDSGAWRGTWALDAGVFSNQGIHTLDRILWLCGPVEEVLSATLKCGFHRTIEAETLGVATVQFASGALGTIAMTTLNGASFPERVDICGTQGGAVLDGDTLTTFRTAAPFEEEDTAQAQGVNLADSTARAADPMALSADEHLGNVRDFVLAVREGRPPFVSPAEARGAVDLLNRIYEKAQVGPFAPHR